MTNLISELVPIPKSELTVSMDNDSPNKGFSFEMSNGTIVKKPSVNVLKKSLSTLNEDNFFLTLTYCDDFIQVTFSSSNKFTMEYKDGTLGIKAHPKSWNLRTQKQFL